VEGFAFPLVAAQVVRRGKPVAYNQFVHAFLNVYRQKTGKVLAAFPLEPQAARRLTQGILSGAGRTVNA
jgi:hypothetical protein